MSKKGLLLALITAISTVVGVGVLFLILALTNVVPIMKANISIESAEYTIEYGNNIEDANAYSITKGSLLKGDKLKIKFYTENLNAGVYDNAFDVKVVNKNGNDVTNRYKINKAYGKLTITQRNLIIKCNDNEKIYDGSVLKADDYTILAGSLASNDTIKATLEGELNDVGTSSAKAYIHVYNEIGSDITKNYNIETRDGTLRVKPIELSIASNSVSKLYDATPLSSDSYEVIGNLIENDRLSYNNQSSIINAGTAINEFDVKVLDSNDNDVSSHYAITKAYGSLTINKRKITVMSKSESKTYDGSLLTMNEVPIVTSQNYDENGNTLEALVAGDQIGWVPGSGITNAGSIDNIFYILSINGTDSNDHIANYDITMKYGTLTVNPIELMVITPNLEKIYDGQVLKGDDYTILNQAEMLDGDVANATFIGNILNAGVTTNSCVINIIDSVGRNVTTNYKMNYSFGTLTVAKRSLSILVSSASKKYDGLALTSPEWYLTSGVMPDGEYLYVNVVGSVSKIGETAANVGTVMIKDSNDSLITTYTNNYDINITNGFLSIYQEKTTIYVAPKNVYVPYIDENTEAHATEIIGFEDYLMDYVPEYTIEGSVVGAGKAISKITSFKIYDTNNNDVTGSFNIVTLDGIVQVYKNELVVMGEDITKTYDGVAVKGSASWVGMDDVTVIYTTSNAVKNAGVYTNFVYVSKVIDDITGDDITNQVKIKVMPGTITINRADLSITSNSKTESYSSTNELSDTNLTIVGLMSEDNAIVSDYTIIKTIGQASNIVKVVIRDSLNNDVTDNYNISYTYGVLKLTN